MCQENSNSSLDSGVQYNKSWLISENETNITTLEGMIFDTSKPYLPVVAISLLTVPVCVAGLISNLINLVVFWRQGFRESVNVSFFCLSISDLVNSALLILFMLTRIDEETGFNYAPVELYSTCKLYCYSST